MPQIFTSTVVTTPVGEVWASLRDFGCDEADEDKVTAAVRDGVLVPGLKALEHRFGPPTGQS